MDQWERRFFFQKPLDPTPKRNLVWKQWIPPQKNLVWKQRIPPRREIWSGSNGSHPEGKSRWEIKEKGQQQKLTLTLGLPLWSWPQSSPTTTTTTTLTVLWPVGFAAGKKGLDEHSSGHGRPISLHSSAVIFWKSRRSSLTSISISPKIKGLDLPRNSRGDLPGRL